MNISDIAKLANVSIATVSRTLNNKSDVSKKTKEKILKIIKEYDYKPNSIARNLVKNENNTIGLIIPDIKNLYFANITNEIINNANKNNLNVILGCSNENFNTQKEYINLFISERVKAIFIIVTKNSKAEIKYFKNLSNKLPLIFIDRKIDEDFYGIYLENYKTTYMSIEKMIKSGSKKIAFISGPLDLSTADERFKAYKDVLRDYNYNYDENLVYYGDFTLDSGYELGNKLIKKDFDSIYISNNLMTLGFLKTLKENNIDVSYYKISTFEDNEIIEFMAKNVCSNNIPFKKIGIKSINLLNKILENKVKKSTIEIKLIK